MAYSRSFNCLYSTVCRKLLRGPTDFSKVRKNSSPAISRFSVSGEHALWVGSTDTPSHAIKELNMR